MKRIGSILLILILIVPFYGTWSWLELQKKKVKKAVKWRIIEGIDRSELVLLSFTHHESEILLRWIHSREFEFNDEMYDIVETLSDPDSVHYWCWWDNEETKLNRELKGVVTSLFGKSSNNNEKINRLVNFCISLYCEDIPEHHIGSYYCSAVSESFYYCNYHPPFIIMKSPPPKAGYL